jgi:hypothetical protein
MDARPHRLLAAALLAAGLATAASATAPLDSPVRLLAPGAGAVLQAGSMATLEWAPGAELARRGRAEGWEEWEAFLSLDGGATYPVRLTPHLDRDLRRVSFRVPDLPTRDGRLLLRLGNERREVAFVLPERLTIAAAPGGSALELPWTVWGRGEPARPGEPGVVAWVEGARHGGPTRLVVAAEPARAVPGVALPAVRPALAAVPSETPPTGAPAADPGARPAPPPPAWSAAATPRAPRPAAADLLLLQKRRNE